MELPGLVADLAGQGLAGLTFAANIPGSVGGAIVGNAGAYGESVSDCLLDVHLLEEGKEHVVEPGRLGFGYRDSLLKSRRDIIVLSASFQLHHGHRHDVAGAHRQGRGPAQEQAPARVRKLRQLLQEPVARAAGGAAHRGRRPQGPACRPRAREREARQLPRRRAGRDRGRHHGSGRRGRAPRQARRAATSCTKKCAASASPDGAPADPAAVARAPAAGRLTMPLRRPRPPSAALYFSRPARRTRPAAQASLTQEEGNRGTAARSDRPLAKGAARGARRALPAVRTPGAAHPLPPGVLRGGRRRRAGSVHQGLPGRDPSRGGVPRVVLPGHPQHRPRRTVAGARPASA